MNYVEIFHKHPLSFFMYVYWVQIKQLAIIITYTVDLNDSQNELEKMIMKHTKYCDLFEGLLF